MTPKPPRPAGRLSRHRIGEMAQKPNEVRP